MVLSHELFFSLYTVDPSVYEILYLETRVCKEKKNLAKVLGLSFIGTLAHHSQQKER